MITVNKLKRSRHAQRDTLCNPTPTQATPMGSLIYAVVTAEMPDGTPIRPSAKVDTILASLGFEDLPMDLKLLMMSGITTVCAGCVSGGDGPMAWPGHKPASTLTLKPHDTTTDGIVHV